MEALVTLDDECGNRCGEYTRLETVFKKVKGLKTPPTTVAFFKTYINEDSIHVSLPTFDHSTIMLVGVSDRENPHL